MAHPRSTTSSLRPGVEDPALHRDDQAQLRAVEGPSSDASSAADAAPPPPPRLSVFEDEVVGFFGDLAQLVGLPRAQGMIYGLLFASPVPLSAADLHQKLELNKGLVTQGLRALRELGAVEVVAVPVEPDGSTTGKTGAKVAEQYLARLELREMVGGFIRDQVEPQLRSGRQRIKRIKAWMAVEHAAGDGESQEPAIAIMRDRIQKLHTWHKKAANIVPWAGKFLG